MVQNSDTRGPVIRRFDILFRNMYLCQCVSILSLWQEHDLNDSLIFNSTLTWFFSLKFPCVCARPRGPQAHLYKRGVEVNLRIKRLEATERFLGFEKDLSLLESECVLLGLKEKAI